jgi:hypothetical protein
MKFEEFKTGTYKQQFQYQSFSPEPINHLWTWEDPTINRTWSGQIERGRAKITI